MSASARCWCDGSKTIDLAIPTPALRVAAFLVPVFAASGVTLAFMPLLLQARGLTPADIGAVLFAGSVLRLLANPAWGMTADRFGGRRVLAVTAACAAIASVALLAAQGFWALAVVTVATGIAAAPLMPLGDVLSLALAREGRLVYAPVRAVGSAAFMAANALAGFVVGAFGTIAVAWLLIANFAAATALAWTLPSPAEAPARPKRRAAAAGQSLLRNRAFLWTLLASGLVQSSHAAFYALSTIHWRAQGVSDAAIGLLWAEGVAAEIAFFLFGRRLALQLGPAGLTACAASAAIVRWTVTAEATAVAVLVGVQLLHAVTYAMQHLSAMTVLSRVVPPERAAIAQTLHAALAIGAPTGFLLWASGRLYDGTGTVFLGMAALGGAGLLVVPALRRSYAAHAVTSCSN